MSIICSCLATFPSLFRHIRTTSLYSKATGSYYKSKTFEESLNGGSNELQSNAEYTKRSGSGQSLEGQYYPPDSKVNQLTLDSVRVQTDVHVTMDEHPESQMWQNPISQV